MLLLAAGVESQRLHQNLGSYAMFAFAVSAKSLVGSFARAEIFPCRNRQSPPRPTFTLCLVLHGD